MFTFEPENDSVHAQAHAHPMRRGGHKWLLLLLPLLPLTSSAAAEPAKDAAPVAAINLSLPVHQQKKLHPEISDPVTGDQTHIMEWAWSPQYAKRFNLPEQPDGLKDGGLWLIGIKVARQQYHDTQHYACNIVGLLDNTLPILMPPGERYMAHPSDVWVGGLPGKAQTGSTDMATAAVEWGSKNFSPKTQTWYKKPATKRQETYPEDSSPFTRYRYFHRSYQIDLAYFELDQPCSYLGDPETLRTELRFPRKLEGQNEKDIKTSAAYAPNAIKFDIPDGLMQRIYPYIVEAHDWSSCLGHRNSGSFLTTHALVTKRFANSCEPVKTSPTTR